MTTTNGWPGKPGVPINPEKDGWHWVNGTPREWVVFDDGPSWRFAGCDYYPHEWADRVYQGPVLTPDEEQNLRDDLVSAERERAHQHSRADRNAAERAREQAKREALQKRVAELETALQFIKDAPDEERKPNFDNMGSYEAGLRYCAAFAIAALGGKDEA